VVPGMAKYGRKETQFATHDFTRYDWNIEGSAAIF
jgi:hypothetical protein